MANHPLQSSGQISLNDIQMEFDRASGTTASLIDARNQVYGPINTSVLPNPLTGNNSVTGQPKDGYHISDWYGFSFNPVTVMSFGTGFSTPGIVTITIQPDGKILCGGGFSTYSGSSADSIARLNTDGSKDVPFTTAGGVGFNASVYAIAVQTGDSKLMIGGFFNTYNAITRNYAVRLNSGGSVDTIHYGNMGTAFNTNTRGIAIQNDGKAVFVGAFTIFDGGTFRHGLVRLNADGTEDISFAANIGAGSTPQVFNFDTFAVAIQSDQKILIGGSFTLFKSATRNRLIRLNSDGTEDGPFYTSLGTGFAGGSINKIKIQSDGKILVGGAFTSLNGTTRLSLVRLNSNGSLDASFYGNLGTAFNGNIQDIDIQSDGKIVIGGFFTSFNGNTRNKLVRLNSDGTEDVSFYTTLISAGNGLAFGADVWAVAIQSAGSILAGGTFTTVNGIARGRICQIGEDGTVLA